MSQILPYLAMLPLLAFLYIERHFVLTLILIPVYAAALFAIPLAFIWGAMQVLS